MKTLEYIDGSSFEVKGCMFPSCGSDAVDLGKDYLNRWWYVECETCFAQGPVAEIKGPGEDDERDAKGRAVDKWNEAYRREGG